MKDTMTETVKEIKRRADFVLDGDQAWDALALRKALVNISNIAHAEIVSNELKLAYKARR